MSKVDVAVRQGLLDHGLLIFGDGVASEVLLGPPLRGDRWFKGHRLDAIVRILLKGETGPIGETEYGEGIMMPLEAAYNDKQLADLINYIGLTWNGRRDIVKPEQIKIIRDEVKDRKLPYTNEELEALKK